MIGKVLGHYRVVEKIGEGGMGVVYLGRDELLHRDVALKVVKQESVASQNLLREARASSSLSHPNICTIHEVGETEGELYIVMELVEGKSLHTLCEEIGLPAGVSSQVWRSDSQRTRSCSRQGDRSQRSEKCEHPHYR